MPHLSRRDEWRQGLNELFTLPPWYHPCWRHLPEVCQGHVRRIRSHIMLCLLGTWRVLRC